MELFDTVPGGSKQIAFADLLLNEKGDSVFVLSHNNRRHYGELDTTIRPIYGEGIFDIIGYDTIPYYPVDSISYGNLIARCDTGNLECDTFQFFNHRPNETFSKPIKILNKSDSHLLIMNYNRDSIPNHKRQYNTLFFI